MALTALLLIVFRNVRHHLQVHTVFFLSVLHSFHFDGMTLVGMIWYDDTCWYEWFQKQLRYSILLLNFLSTIDSLTFFFIHPVVIQFEPDSIQQDDIESDWSLEYPIAVKKDEVNLRQLSWPSILACPCLIPLFLFNLDKFIRKFLEPQSFINNHFITGYHLAGSTRGRKIHWQQPGEKWQRDLQLMGLSSVPLGADIHCLLF